MNKVVKGKTFINYRTSSSFMFNTVKSCFIHNMKSLVKINSQILFYTPSVFYKTQWKRFQKHKLPSISPRYRNLHSLEVPVDSTRIKRLKCLKVSSDEPSSTSLISWRFLTLRENSGWQAVDGVTARISPGRLDLQLTHHCFLRIYFFLRELSILIDAIKTLHLYTIKSTIKACNFRHFDQFNLDR